MKSMKKLVLVAFVLLASVMVLAGCKMEAGSEGAKVPKIYEFTNEPQILTNYESPNSTGDEYIYVAFGDWPQKIKASEVTVDESKSKQMGMFTAYLGSDGNYYVKEKENASGSGDAYQYSDGTQAGQGGTSEKWFKVEPIVWRVLDKDYASTGKALLLAEKILISGIPYYSVDKVKRTIGGVEIFTNNYEHSQIRAFLNGLSYEYKESDSEDQSKKNEYEGKGFLQTAFTTSAQKLIAETTVDNSKESTFGRGETGGDNPYVCTNTSDKIFLLSEQEATTAGYDFDVYNVSDNTRIRVNTDYAKATGAYQSSTDGYGGWWWLRSPYCNDEDYALLIGTSGDADGINLVNNNRGGVVPALSISINGN